MAEFIIRTTDSTYSYNVSTQSGGGSDTAKIDFSNQQNAKFSDTQGYQRKKQVGRNRIQAKVDIDVTQANYEDIFIPMDQYPTDVVVTFDRVIPTTGSTQGTFVLEKIRKLRELPDSIYGIELTLTEVLDPL
jgi:hypothetical protein